MIWLTKKRVIFEACEESPEEPTNAFFSCLSCDSTCRSYKSTTVAPRGALLVFLSSPSSTFNAERFPSCCDSSGNFWQGQVVPKTSKTPTTKILEFPEDAIRTSRGRTRAITMEILRLILENRIVVEIVPPANLAFMVRVGFVVPKTCGRSNALKTCPGDKQNCVRNHGIDRSSLTVPELIQPHEYWETHTETYEKSAAF